MKACGAKKKWSVSDELRKNKDKHKSIKEINRLKLPEGVSFVPHHCLANPCQCFIK